MSKLTKIILLALSAVCIISNSLNVVQVANSNLKKNNIDFDSLKISERKAASFSDSISRLNDSIKVLNRALEEKNETNKK